MNITDLSTARHLSPTVSGTVRIGSLPTALRDTIPFENLWEMHPAEFPVINLFGPKLIPRWQQAFGHDYQFSQQTNRALPVPSLLVPLLDWAKESIDPRLNGLLLNWYDGSLRHHIGAHRDSRVGLVPGSSFVTVSFGEARTFRFSRKMGDRKFEVRDFAVEDGSVLIFDWDTNLHWKHAVPRFAADQGRRISVTLRAFEVSADGAGAGTKPR